MQYGMDQKLVSNVGASSHLLLLPTLIDDLSAPELAFLQQDLALPLVFIYGVDVPARLDTESTAVASSGLTLNSRDVDVFASVELERWLCAQDFKVKACVRVIERG